MQHTDSSHGGFMESLDQERERWYQPVPQMQLGMNFLKTPSKYIQDFLQAMTVTDVNL